MADKNRAASINTEKVFKQPGQAVSFFQSVQLLLKSAPAAVTPGNKGPLTKEHIIFRSNASLAFPVREVPARAAMGHRLFNIQKRPPWPFRRRCLRIAIPKRLTFATA